MSSGFEITQDSFLEGNMRLNQPKKGHRIGTDALLLAAAAPLDRFNIADLGAGVGGAGIVFALRANNAHLTLVERDAAIAVLARENLALNDLEARSRVVEVDLFTPAKIREAAGLMPHCMDLVLTNPPFFNQGEIRCSPDKKKRSAYTMDGGNLNDWVRSAAHILRPNGVFIMIHRADAMEEVLKALDTRFGSVMLMPVYSSLAKPAVRLLIKAVLGSKAKLSVAPAFYIRDERGDITPEMAALNSMKSVVDWSNGGIKSI